MMILKPVLDTPTPCKICGEPAPLYGVIDFNKCSEEPRGMLLPLSGTPVYYRRCKACDFLFTDAFDDWSHDEFKAHIYNDGYLTVDPDYKGKRAHDCASVIQQHFGAHRAGLRVLDYGGGNDIMCSELRAAGFPVAATYDPFVPDYAQQPEGKFNLITCFETLEHMPDPATGINCMLASIAESGLVLFSTLLQPQDFDKYGLKWWYVAPRNGHVSLFSRKALVRAWEHHGYQTMSFNDNLHVAFRTLPAFAKHLLK
jgi:hypothetical protein